MTNEQELADQNLSDLLVGIPQGNKAAQEISKLLGEQW